VSSEETAKNYRSITSWDDIGNWIIWASLLEETGGFFHPWSPNPDSLTLDWINFRIMAKESSLEPGTVDNQIKTGAPFRNFF